jgi:N6-L-threonylcarbamoyladenine synthase
MTILGIETSCDETSAAVIEGEKRRVFLKSNVIATSLSIHAQTGGVIPENAAREQIKHILPVVSQALSDAKTDVSQLDAVAVTYGPGLIGSLLVGVETAKTISYVFNKPIIPVNHMIGHIYANFVSENSKLDARRYALDAQIEFPAIALVVSGGHTDLLLMKGHGDFELLGGTRDDAAGEAFDKIGRLLGLPYPAGPEIEKRAKKANPKRFRFPRPLIGSADFDFSFSGLKTAVLREVQNLEARHLTLEAETINDLALATQESIIDVLTKKTLKAAEKFGAKSILLSGGVAANQSLRDRFSVLSSLPAGRQGQFSVKLFAPAKSLCTDNAAMIACAGFYNSTLLTWKDITANPELYY